MRIAFAGNPNSGKTTMYNALTGRNEKVGNWAGVTVDKKEAHIKKVYAGDKELIAVDLPGAYSMSPFTSEESVTSTYIKNEHLDAIINIVDATNLSRSLFFTTQLLELGIPVVVALNKADINKKKSIRCRRGIFSSSRATRSTISRSGAVSTCTTSCSTTPICGNTCGACAPFRASTPSFSSSPPTAGATSSRATCT